MNRHQIFSILFLLLLNSTGAQAADLSLYQYQCQVSKTEQGQSIDLTFLASLKVGEERVAHYVPQADLLGEVTDLAVSANPPCSGCILIEGFSEHFSLGRIRGEAFEFSEISPSSTILKYHLYKFDEGTGAEIYLGSLDGACRSI